MGAVILGIEPELCDGVYPRTHEGRCQGCGTTAVPHPLPTKQEPRFEDPSRPELLHPLLKPMHTHDPVPTGDPLVNRCRTCGAIVAAPKET